MDTRQIQNNTFQEGIISDLHPLTTPNTCLIDSLNATVLTYNGNEFLLQNDQGNYKLEHCKLSSNFIPVGIKEYGDILYIASYNPISKETEIGTYPSPRTIFSTKDRDQKVVFIPLVDNTTPSPSDYTDLTEKAKLQVYALADDMENFKLNPGDKFIILLGTEESFPYQTIQYLILTEDKTLIPIDIPLDEDYIWPLNSHVDDEDFKNVFWEVPGWLAGKYRLAVMDQFYLNVRNVTLPEFKVGDTFDVTDIQINTQMEVTDELFRNNPNLNADTLRDLKVEYTVTMKGQGAPQPSSYIGSFNEHSYNDDMDIYYNNWNFDVSGATIDSTIVITAIPILNYGGKQIRYDQFETSVEINLASINDARDINAANNIYKYMVDDDSLTLSFNVEGPFINNSSIETWLEIYKISENTTVPERIYRSRQLDTNLLGTNTFDIPIYNPDDPQPGISTKLVKEDMYILSIIFKDGDVTLKHINRLLVMSEVMNDFYNSYDNFQEIALDQWINKYYDRLRTSNLNITETDLTDPGTYRWSDPIGEWPTDISIVPDSDNNAVIDYGDKQKYNWTVESPVAPAAPLYTYGVDTKVKFDFRTGIDFLKGPLWDITGNNILDFDLSYNDRKIPYSIPDFNLTPENDEDVSSKTIEQFIGGNTQFKLIPTDTSMVTVYNYTPNYIFKENCIGPLQPLSGYGNITNDDQYPNAGWEFEAYRIGSWMERAMDANFTNTYTIDMGSSIIKGTEKKDEPWSGGKQINLGDELPTYPFTENRGFSIGFIGVNIHYAGADNDDLNDENRSRYWSEPTTTIRKDRLQVSGEGAYYYIFMKSSNSSNGVAVSITDDNLNQSLPNVISTLRAIAFNIFYYQKKSSDSKRIMFVYPDADPGVKIINDYILSDFKLTYSTDLKFKNNSYLTVDGIKNINNIIEIYDSLILNTVSPGAEQESLFTSNFENLTQDGKINYSGIINMENFNYEYTIRGLETDQIINAMETFSESVLNYQDDAKAENEERLVDPVLDTSFPVNNGFYVGRNISENDRLGLINFAKHLQMNGTSPTLQFNTNWDRIKFYVEINTRVDVRFSNIAFFDKINLPVIQ